MQGTGGLCSFVLIYRNTRPPQGVFLSPAFNHDIYQHNKQYSKHDHNKNDSVQERQAFNEKKPNRQPISVISIKVSVITISILILRRTAFTGKTANRFG